MDIVSELTSLLNIPILITGLLIGYVIKHLINNEQIQNKWIPVINILVGAALGIIFCISGAAAVTVESIVLSAIGGAVSCVSSSGFYDAFKAFVEEHKITSVVK